MNRFKKIITSLFVVSFIPLVLISVIVIPFGIAGGVSDFKSEFYKGLLILSPMAVYGLWIMYRSFIHGFFSEDDTMPFLLHIAMFPFSVIAYYIVAIILYFKIFS